MTSACLMAVRNSVQGLLGNRCYKEWMEDRAADSKPCDTLTDVELCTSQRVKTEKRALNERPTAKLSVQCPQPRGSQPKKGSSRCLTTGMWGFSWQNKTIKHGGWTFFRSIFPSLAFVTLKPLLLSYFSRPSAFSPCRDQMSFFIFHFYLPKLFVFRLTLPPLPLLSQ